MNQRLNSSSEFDLAAIAPGTHAWRHLHFSGGMRVPVTLPIAIARGLSDGPTVLVTGLVHGDEFEGPTAIADFFNTLDTEHLSGTFLGLPLTNPWAYAGQSRNTPDHYDGLNLARQFPGDAEGSRTQQHARLLYEWVTRTLTPDDVFIDFHSAGTYYEYLSMVGFHPTADTAEAVSKSLALAFGIDNVWRIPQSPSSTRTFNGSIARSGIPTVGTEVTGLGGLREDDVTQLKQGLHNVLIQKGMLSGSVPDISRTISSTQTLTFSSTGLFRIKVDLGESVTIGQSLGRVVSIEGDLLETITSPIEGHVGAVRRFASVHPGDIAFLIGQAE